MRPNILASTRSQLRLFGLARWITATKTSSGRPLQVDSRPGPAWARPNTPFVHTPFEVFSNLSDRFRVRNDGFGLQNGCWTPERSFQRLKRSFPTPINGGSKFLCEKINLKFWLGGVAPQTPQFLAGGAKPPQSPPLNGRSSHLIEAAKRGHLDQMIFVSAPLTTRAPPTTVRPDVRPNARPNARRVDTLSRPAYQSQAQN